MIDERLREIVSEALAVAPAGRAALIERLSGGDAALAEAARRMVLASEAAERQGSPPAPETADLPAGGVPGESDGFAGNRIGPYGLVQLIGEGGFGEVWMAEQEGAIRRQVALKIIKLGMDTRRVIARFESERQALAMMDHPSIARVFDAGATRSGRPYFVMELVRGSPITRYCDERRLPAAERIVLFAEVCSAVQHAHQKGVIHRDIKPSNVLVTVLDGRAVPKVIDFGIAKATGHQLTDKTLFTELNQLVGTPAYMSPEQAGLSGLDVDTRSDVYALGVLLYELLTGTTPLDAASLRRAAHHEMQRMIREVDPPKPSTRLTQSFEALPSIAANRSAEPRQLSAMLRGDIDWIVMKSLEKDRARRYGSAAALAEDLRRHLCGEAVLAAPPSWRYRARKFARRHRKLLAAASAVGVSLLAGIVGVSLQAHRLRVERDATSVERDRALAAEAAARDERDRAGAISEFFVDSMKSAAPEWGGRQGRTIEEAMSEAQRQIDAGAMAGQPARQEQVLQIIAEVLTANGRAGEAERPARRALEIAEAERPPHDGDTARLLVGLAGTLERMGRYAEAESKLLAALAINERPGQLATDLARTRHNLGRCQLDEGRTAEAEASLTMALREMERAGERGSSEYAVTELDLASVRKAEHKVAEALSLQEAALASLRALRGADDPEVAVVINNLGLSLLDLGRTREARSRFEEALEMFGRLFRGDHPGTALAMSNLGGERMAEGRPEEALPLFERSLAMLRRVFPGDHPQVARGLDSLAQALLALKRDAEAEPLEREAIDMFRRVYPGDHADEVRALNNMGAIERNLRRLPEAIALYQQSLDMVRRIHPGDNGDVANQMKNLARCMGLAGRDGEALAMALRAAEMAALALPPSDPIRARCDQLVAELRSKHAGPATHP
jgi:serine/threonine protein kinase/tetratricopeptide (TPR) repeat protein